MLLSNLSLHFIHSLACRYHTDDLFRYYDIRFTQDIKFTMPQPDGMSGEGGAMYLEGASALTEYTSFTSNYCGSGGTDNGASGGAVSIVSYNAGPDDGEKQEYPTQSTFQRVIFRDNVASSSNGRIAEKASGRGGESEKKRSE